MESLLSNFAARQPIGTSGALEHAETPSASNETDMANLIISDSGEQKYIGPSSSFALFSPRGLAWIQRKIGSTRVATVLQKFRSRGPMWASYWINQQWDAGYAGECRLPSKDAAVQLANCYFKAFNSTFPLIEQASFWALFEQQYSVSPPSKKSWFGVLNVVLSIGCIVATDSVWASARGYDSNFCSTPSKVSWRLFQNASSVLVDILLLDSDLMGVQTAVGMAYIMQAAMNPEAAFVLIGIAARLSSALGLHRWLVGFGLSSAELGQRHKVFWIMYTVEKDISSRVDRPSAIDDDDIDFDIPFTHCDDELALQCPSHSNAKFYPFQGMCTLARIESKVYKELYSSSARAKTTSERLQAIGRLDAELQEWKESFPVEIRPEHPIQCDPESRFPIVLLHFGYYYCLTAIHRVNAHHELWSSENEKAENQHTSFSPRSHATTSNEGLTARVHTSYALCLAAARSILHLSVVYLENWSDPRNSLIWIAPYFPFSAFLTLFSHMIHSPLELKVAEDQALMERTLGCVVGLSHMQDKKAISLMADVIGELFAIANEHVENVRAGIDRREDGLTSMKDAYVQGGTIDLAQKESAPSFERNASNSVLQAEFNARPDPASIERAVGPGFALNQSTGYPPYPTGDGFDPNRINDSGYVPTQQSLIDDPFFFFQDTAWDWSF